MKILIYCPNSEIDKTSFGGLPVALDCEFTLWPKCCGCERKLRFLGKIATENCLLNFYMCSSDECPTGDPDFGANKVVSVPYGDLRYIDAPAEDNTICDYEYGAVLIEYNEDESYNAAYNRLIAEDNFVPSQILGHIGGELPLYELNTIPDCDICKEPMHLVSKLEDRPLGSGLLLYLGGYGYVFDCACGGPPKMIYD